MFPRISRFISRANTRFKVSEKVAVLLLVMVLVAVVNIGIIYTYHHQVDAASNSVNVAGQQRMLTQRMAWFASDIAAGENPDRAREKLRIAVERYDDNLHALRFGGTVPDTDLNPAVGTNASSSLILRGEVLREPPSAARDELAAEAALWESYRPHVRTVLTADPETAAFEESYRIVRSRSDELLSKSDAATAALTSAIRDKRAALQRMLALLLGVDLAVAVVGGLFARRYLGKPMANMAKKGLALADGDLDSTYGANPPIDRSIPRADQRAELARLSQSFDEVQEYLQTVSGQAQALAAREFDADVFASTVPGELGRSLEAMQTDLQSYIRDLQTTTEKLNAIIAASPAAIYITDTRGIVRRWNPAALEIFGWSEASVLDEHDPTIPKEEREAYRELRSRVLAGESLSGVERRRTTKSGETIDVSISTATVRAPDGSIEGIMTVAEDISERKEQERMLRRQRDELESLLRVTDLILESTRELVETSDEDRIEALVCKRLADGERYTSAVITTVLGDGGIAIRESAYTDGHQSLTTAEQEMVRRTAESGEARVRSVPGEHDARESNARTDTPTREVATIPVTHRGTLSGVLLVGTVTGREIRERELAGMETLGKTIGFARNAISNEKLLFADSVLELRFSAADSSLPFVQTTDRLGCSIGLDGFVASSTDDSVTLYLDVDGAAGDAFVETVREEPEISDAWIVAAGDRHVRIGVVLAETSSLVDLATSDVTLRTIDLSDGAGDVGFEAPVSIDVSAVVARITDRYPDLEFAAKRERDRPVTTAADIATALRSDLTDRQYEIFETAYFGGYFEWPRDNTIEDLAERVDIAGSTFHHHLRHALRKLARALLEEPEEEDYLDE
ncbi:MAG: bacterio-opsin activator domain-containing protein [Halanaeroarchaeum sp.]